MFKKKARHGNNKWSQKVRAQPAKLLNESTSLTVTVN